MSRCLRREERSSIVPARANFPLPQLLPILTPLTLLTPLTPLRTSQSHKKAAINPKTEVTKKKKKQRLTLTYPSHPGIHSPKNPSLAPGTHPPTKPKRHPTQPHHTRLSRSSTYPPHQHRVYLTSAASPGSQPPLLIPSSVASLPRTSNRHAHSSPLPSPPHYCTPTTHTVRTAQLQ